MDENETVRPAGEPCWFRKYTEIQSHDPVAMTQKVSDSQWDKKKIASLLKLLLGLLILPPIFQLLLSCEMEWASEHKHELPAKDIRSCRRNWTLYWTWPPAEGRRHLHLCCWLQCPFLLHPPNIQKHISPLYIVWQVDKVCKTIVKQIEKFKLIQAPKLRSKLH